MKCQCESERDRFYFLTDVVELAVTSAVDCVAGAVAVVVVAVGLDLVSAALDLDLPPADLGSDLGLVLAAGFFLVSPVLESAAVDGAVGSSSASAAASAAACFVDF